MLMFHACAESSVICRDLAWCGCYDRTMSDHLTLRVRTGTADRLERRAKATGTPARTLAAIYVDEGLRRDDHPLVHFVAGETGRRAALIGTGLDVWEAIECIRDNGNDVSAAAAYLGVSEGMLEAAVAYYGEFKDEIEAEIDLNRAESAKALAQWQAGRAALAG